MKRTLLIALLSTVAVFSFAQKRAVKDAKSAISKTAEARGLIKPALTNEETAQDPETWKVAGDIEYKSFDAERDAEMTKGMTGKGANEDVMYTGLYNLVDYYVKADELGQLPDAKSKKVKNKFRKDIIKNLKEAYPLYINGGIYYNDKATADRDPKMYAKATDFFELYWTIPDLDVLKGENIVVKDSIYQTIKYYTVISSIQSENSDRSVGLLKKLISEPYILNSAYVESDPYELLAAEYQKMEDSVNFVDALRQGANKFPKNQYFTPNLINEYIRAGKSDEAMQHLEQAVKNDPESACELLGVKGSLLANDKKYDESIAVYKDALNKDASCERSLEGLGVVYVLQAQDLKESISQITNRQKLAEIDKQTISLYKESLPLLEKYVELLRARKVEASDLRPALVKLQNVYYNLSLLNVDKNAELEAIEKELN